DDGHTISWISNSFATSSEFQNRYGSLSNADFVRRVYRNVLGRDPDASGLSYWTNKLKAGTTRGQVMANFSQSSEYIAKAADGTHVISVYEDMLQRAVADDEYTLFVAGLANSSTSLTSIAGYVYDSDEYRARVS
ncbi:MAG: hypothetical protein JWM89_4065, partial [Acidimicrobiales bacterium]|nr:hypothetical protein [Acidimicrobiales bacterium]